MKEMTKKDILALGRDMINAKVGVLLKYGFTIEEITNALGVPESIVRRVEKQLNEN